MATDAMLTALKELRTENPTLHTAMKIILGNHHPGDRTAVYQHFLKALKNYDHDDLAWYVGYLREHRSLAEYFHTTVEQLNSEQFNLHCERIEDLWEELTELPGVDSEIAYSVLTNYPDRDPGTKRSHGTAVFKINTALLATMETTEYKPEKSGLFVTTIDQHTGEERHALNQRMIDFAINRAPDADRIVGIILTKHFWHPEAITYELDGELVPTTPVEGLAYTIIMQVCDGSEDRLDQYIMSPVAEQTLSHTEMMRVNAAHTHSMIGNLVERITSNDLEALRKQTELITDYSVHDAAFQTHALEQTINDLRSLGHTNLRTLDQNAYNRTQDMAHAIGKDLIERNSVLDMEDPDWENYCSALRTVTVLGDKTIQSYIDHDPQRTIKLTVEHRATTHQDLTTVLQEVISHGALADGYL